MTFFCQICTEDLDKISKVGDDDADSSNAANQQSQSEDANVSSLRCGHMFHTSCIQKWLCGNLESSKNCPCCRCPSNLTCNSLFPALRPTSLLPLASKDKEERDPLFGLQRKVENLQRNLNDQTLLVSLKNSDLENVRAELAKKSDLLDMKSEQLIDKSRECTILLAELNKTEVYEDLFYHYKTRLCQTETSVLKYSRIVTSFLNNGTSTNTTSVNTIGKIKKSSTEELESFTLKVLAQWEQDNQEIDHLTIDIPSSIVRKWKLDSGASNTIEDSYQIKLPTSFPQVILPTLSTDDTDDTENAENDDTSNTMLPPGKHIVTLRKKGDNCLHVTWSLPLEDSSIQRASVKSYEVYICKVNVSGPENLAATYWEKIGNVNSKKLPMGMVINNEFEDGMAYVVILRGIDKFRRLGPFSIPQCMYPD